MEKELNKLKVKHTRIEAINGKKLETYDYNLSLLTLKSNTPGEIACTLSHLKAIKTSYDNNDSMCIIMEDDVCFELCKYWTKPLKQVVKVAPKDWEILQLNTSNANELWKFYETKAKPYLKWNELYYGTVCYLINRNGMNKIIDKYNGKLLNTSKFVSDYIVYINCITYTLTKPLFLHMLFSSLIQQERMKQYNGKEQYWGEKSNKLISKYMYKRFVSCEPKYSNANLQLKGFDKKDISPLNIFYDKIFVINLKNKTERWKKIKARFNKKNIVITRFEGIDGRCKDIKKCKQLLNKFEKMYKVKFNFHPKKLKNLLINVPAAGVTIGTILLLREQVKNGWKRILISEDDIVLTDDINRIFKQGIKEVPDDWDILYIGCGYRCGWADISLNKTKHTPHCSSWDLVKSNNVCRCYVHHKDDLRILCNRGKCIKLGKHISIPETPGGAWFYSYSLKGAKTMLKFLGNNNGIYHIDASLQKAIKSEKLKVYAFDPPLVMHENGAFRVDSDIPWKST